MKSKKILVTGAAGFIAPQLIKVLVDQEYEVIAVDIREIDKDRAHLLKGSTFIQADLRVYENMKKVSLDVDRIFHLASDMGGVGYFTAHDYYPYINNMQMDLNVLRACEENKVKHLFYSSSACVYPIDLQMIEGDSSKLAENMIYPANADKNYGWEKLMMLRLCEQAQKQSLFDARVGIFHGFYGEFQEWEGERAKSVIALARKAIESRKSGQYEIWGNGKQLRSYIHIEDGIKKILSIAFNDCYHGPINVGTEGAVTVKEVAELCCQIAGSDPEFNFAKSKPSGVLSRDCDNTKFKMIYGYDNQITLREGLERTISWLDKEFSGVRDE